MAAPHTGGCLCAGVRYRVDADPLTLYACHCTDCQRRTGSAFALSLVVRRDALVVETGTPAPYAATLADGRTKQGRMCAACGTRLWGEPGGDARIAVVQAGTLDDTSWLRPVAHIWARSAQPWVVFPLDVTVFAEQPAEFRELIALARPVTRDDVGLARPDEVAMLQAIELAAARLFSSDDLPPAQRDDAMPLDTLTAALVDGRLWVARDGGGRPVGFAVGDVVDGRPHLAEVSVHPDHGRRGLGTRLLDAVADWARERGSLLTLTTFAHVAWNAPYYARRGFRPLRDDEQGPELRAILRAEAGAGLRNRVAMGRPLEPSEPAFRVAEPADLPAIVRLLADDVLGGVRERDETPLPPSYRAAFDAIAADPDNELLVACLGDRVVGVLQLTYTPHVLHQGGWRATIEGVRVASTLRSRGVGQAMFRAAFARARARGCAVAQLTTDKRRPEAKRFYERLGFQASHEGMKKRLD